MDLIERICLRLQLRYKISYKMLEMKKEGEDWRKDTEESGTKYQSSCLSTDNQSAMQIVRESFGNYQINRHWIWNFRNLIWGS